MRNCSSLRASSRLARNSSVTSRIAMAVLDARSLRQ